MILVDTSVVIDSARGRDAKLAALLPTLSTAVCGIVRAEMLAGARDPKHRANLLTLLATFHQIAIPEPLWDKAGDHLAALRSAGVTVPFADAVIATVAIENDIELWVRDAQFALIQNVLPVLRLFVEPSYAVSSLQLGGQGHRRVDLPGVGQVEAQAGLRQPLEIRGQLAAGAAGRLAAVHVLQVLGCSGSFDRKIAEP